MPWRKQTRRDVVTFFIFLSLLGDLSGPFSSQINSGQRGAREPPYGGSLFLSLLEGRLLSFRGSSSTASNFR